MNYKKKNISKKKATISSKKNMKKKRVGVRVFKAVILCFLLLCIAGIAGGCFFVKKIIDDTPAVTPADVKPSGYKSQVIAASTGEPLAEFVDAGTNRIYKTIDEIPDYLAHAFVAVEDERFYQHNGIDLQGILRAGIVGLTSGGFSEGASTLTQQLIKNNVFPNFVAEKTFYDKLERKLQEQYLALEIEHQMSKDEVLEAYMNTINLGQNCLGVQAASKRYFNKDVSQLTLSESAVIAAITQNPTLYDPVVNPDQNLERRDVVLQKLLEQGYITQQDFDEAKADNVYERIQQTAIVTDTNKPNSYFVDELTEQVLQDLIERKNYTQTQAHNLLYGGGLTIYATLDPTIQRIADEEVANPNNYPYLTEYGLEYALTITRSSGAVENYSKEMLAEYIRAAWGREYPLVFSSPDEANQAIAEYKSTLNIQEGDVADENITITPQPQVSVVIMDQYNGEVKAIVGGRGEKKASFSLNRATDSTRQPGSCFKPLAVYAPALDSGKYTLSSMIDDSKPFQYPNGKGTVENWDDIYTGSASLRKAIWHSMNVPAVTTLADIGPQLGYDYLLNFGFSTIVGNNDENYQGYTDINLPTALGGITRGVYNLELTAAYAAIANNGVYTKPIFYTKVLDHEGNIILDNSTPETHQVIKDSTAALLTNAMEDVIKIGTGTTARLASGMAVSGKTGTSENSRDLWFAAFTPYYTASVWGGYDSEKPMENINTQVWHEVLWKSIMDRVISELNLEVKTFTMPSSVEQKSVCTSSGLLATNSCSAYTEYYAKGTGPTQSCSGHYTKPAKEEKTDSSQNTTDEGTTDSSDTTVVVDEEIGNESSDTTTSDTNSGETGGTDGTEDTSQTTE